MFPSWKLSQCLARKERRLGFRLLKKQTAKNANAAGIGKWTLARTPSTRRSVDVVLVLSFRSMDKSKSNGWRACPSCGNKTRFTDGLNSKINVILLGHHTKIVTEGA